MINELINQSDHLYPEKAILKNTMNTFIINRWKGLFGSLKKGLKMLKL